MDYAATTPVREEVKKKVIKLLDTCYGNPSAIYSLGRQAAVELQKARKSIAKGLNVPDSHIIFTSGATESNNHVIHSTVRSASKKHSLPHIITSPLEHPSVLNPLRFLQQQQNIDLTILPVDSDGMVDLDVLKSSFKSGTAMVSIGAVSSETGTVQDIHAISKICNHEEILFHSDYSQAIRCPEIRKLIPKCGLVTLSSHKNYSIKGAGLIIADKSNIPQSLILGGAQEKGVRAGTENVLAAAGLGAAIQLLTDDPLENRVKSLRNKLHQLINTTSDQFMEICSPMFWADSYLCYVVKNVDAEKLLIALDMQGVCASSGSACSTGNRLPSEALQAMGYTPEESMCMLRLTLGRFNNEDEIFQAAKIISNTAEKLS